MKLKLTTLVKNLYLLGYKSEGMVQALNHRTGNCKHRYDTIFAKYWRDVLIALEIFW